MAADALNHTFRMSEANLVDKTHCLTLGGRKQETGVEYIDLIGDISFGSDKPDHLLKEYPGTEGKTVYEPVIGA